MNDEDARISSALCVLMDQLTTLNRRLTGVRGYMPIKRKELHRELGQVAIEIQGLRQAELQPE